MAVEHLSSEADPERIVEVLRRDGCAVVDRATDPKLLERIRREMTTHLEAVAPGGDDFAGKHTRRVGGLIARSPASRELITHPLVLDSVKKLLSQVTNFQLHLTQIIAIGPGESPQPVHRDQWAFDFFPFPTGYEVQCNTLWAMTDFTEANGATRVIPGSHRYEDKLRYELADTEPAEMEAGSVLFYTGSLYHGGGPNRTESVRMGFNLTYTVGWLRQEENQYLSVPFEVARQLPDPLLRLMGYAQGAYALGYVDDLRDPLDVLKPGRRSRGFGDAERMRERAQRELTG